MRLYLAALALLTITWVTAITLLDKWPTLANHWSIALTMVAGSFVAGSTPAGGAAIAFPVMTKLLGVAPNDARTFGLMIQTIGMGMATLFIFARRIPLYRRVLHWALPSGIIGLLIGLTLLRDLPPAAPKLIFTTLILCAGLALALSRWALRWHPKENAPFPVHTPARRATLIIGGLIGGSFAAIHGSGMDLTLFTIMALGYGLPERRAIATSVVLMATISAIGFIARIASTAEPIPPIVWDYWLTCIPIVAIGAPIGAWVAAHAPRDLLLLGILALVILETTSTILMVPIPPHFIPYLALFATAILSLMAAAVLRRSRISA